MPEDKLSKEELYQKEQIALMKGLVVGAKDIVGLTISKIFAKGDEYLIYEAAGLNPLESMRILMYPKKEEDLEPYLRYQEVKDEFDRFKSIWHKTRADESYKLRAAGAITLAIYGKIDEAKELFNKIISEAESEYRRRLIGRLFYLSGGFLLALIMATAAIFAYLKRDMSYIIGNFALVEFIYAAAFSAFGGLFSISYKSKGLFLDSALNHFMYAIYGAERIIFSIIGGVFSITLIKSDFAVGFISSHENGIYGMLVFCFLAGFSETLIPNTLNKIESEENNSNK